MHFRAIFLCKTFLSGILKCDLPMPSRHLPVCSKILLNFLNFSSFSFRHFFAWIDSNFSCFIFDCSVAKISSCQEKFRILVLPMKTSKYFFNKVCLEQNGYVLVLKLKVETIPAIQLPVQEIYRFR
jgi:hypothetical protein